MASSSSSSSSSSFDSSSSSSFDSSSSSSSVDSSSSSSSSSFGLSSSSSSSLWDTHDSRLIPFTVGEEKNDPAWAVTFYGDYTFVGTGSKGEILRSSDRYHWGLYYKTNDLHVSALTVDGTYLYAGTAPNGKLYRFNMADDSVTYYGELGSKIADFAKYGDILYAGAESGKIYSFNSVNDQWDFEYKTYGEIAELDVINGKMYAATKGENVVTYDGINWLLVDLGEYNIASTRNVTGEFSFVDFSSLNRSSIISTNDNEEIYEIFPQNRSLGLSCIEQDGSSIIMGSSNKARVYSLLNDELKLLFDTNSNNVHDLLNIDLGVNLATIDNKLYLIHCGSLTTTTETPSSSSEEDPNAGKDIVITYPNGGEEFALGDNVTIQWSSTRNQNDAVKLELYKGNTVADTIVAKTSNDGQFIWTVPLSLEAGADYKVYIEWLSAGTATEDEKDFSDSPFTIALTATTTTTTTTATIDPQAPDTSICRGIPILILPEDEYITKMTKDDTLNAIMLLTSAGRILECKESVINGYLTGERTIWATVKDGMGMSNVASNQFMYALYNRIAEVNEEKEIVKWKYVEEVSAIPVDKVHGIFISPALYVQEDIGAWKQLLWTETKYNDTDIVISLKAANSLSELEGKEWEYSFESVSGEVGSITRDLSNRSLQGQYLQIKVDMSSTTSVSPAVANVSVVYSAKNASYFFSTRFALENGSDINTGLAVAKITEPVNTEVQMGICGIESADWNDYTIISPEKFFAMDDFENIKVGLKFVTYDETNVPEVGNFALIFSGDKKQIVEV